MSGDDASVLLALAAPAGCVVRGRTSPEATDSATTSRLAAAASAARIRSAQPKASRAYTLGRRQRVSKAGRGHPTFGRRYALGHLGSYFGEPLEGRVWVHPEIEPAWIDRSDS